MLKKTLAIVSALACVLVGTSCTGGSGGTSSASASKAIKNYDPDEECTISISWWGGDERNEATEEAIALFEDKYPNIHVTTDSGAWSGWKSKIFDELDEGTCTDVIQVNYDWLVTKSYDGSGFFDLEALGDYIDLSNFTEDVLQFGRRNGVLNAIPVSMTTRSLFYNKATYDLAGVDIPTTWDELFEVAPKLNAVGSYALNCDNGSSCTAWYICVAYEQQKTGKQFITDDGEIGFTVDEIADALQFYKDMQDSGVIRSVQQIKSQDTEDNLYDCNSWQSGLIGGICEWGSSVAKYQDTLEDPENLVMGELLTMDNAQSVGWMYKPSLLFAINKDTEYPVQSALLLDFLYNDPECVEILGTTRGIPVSSTALSTLESDGLLTGLAYESNGQILNNNLVLISPYMENNDMTAYYNEAIESVSLGLLTPQEASQGIYANIIFTLDELKEGK